MLCVALIIPKQIIETHYVIEFTRERHFLHLNVPLVNTMSCIHGGFGFSIG